MPLYNIYEDKNEGRRSVNLSTSYGVRRPYMGLTQRFACRPCRSAGASYRRGADRKQALRSFTSTLKDCRRICNMTTREAETGSRQGAFEGECAFFVRGEHVQQESWPHMPTKITQAKGFGRGTWLKSKQKALLSMEVASSIPLKLLICPGQQAGAHFLIIQGTLQARIMIRRNSQAQSAGGQ